MKHGVVASVGGIGLLLVVGGVIGCGEEREVAAANGPPARPLQTGQASCYDANSVVIPCAGTGQDGATQTGVARRYVDNGDGTITDVSTGLMWEKKSFDGSLHDLGNVYGWNEVFAVFISGLNSARFAGHSDWRLPNVNELQSIVNYGTSDPAVDAVFYTNCVRSCMVTTCSCTLGYFHWSSTPSQDDPYNVWALNFLVGVVTPLSKGNHFYARAVRGGV